MSYGAFSTKNNTGLRNVRSAAALAGIPGPAETPAVAALYPTHRLAGLGSVLLFEHPSPIITPPSVSSQSSPTPNTPAPSTQPTPVANPLNPNICPAFGCNIEPIVRFAPIFEPSNPSWMQQQQQQAPSPSTQTTPTPTIPATTPAPPATGVALTSGAATTAQAGTPVPVGYPTNQTYTDSAGNIWSYTASGGWQVTTFAAASIAASSPQPAVTVNAATDWVGSLTAWLQESTIISSVPNFWLVAAGGVGALLLWPKGRR